MSEMIERVAQALAPIYAPAYKTKAEIKPMLPYLRMLAKAAILAMREPTKKMSKAATIELHLNDLTQRYVPDQIWEKMIDTALEETP